MEMYKTGAKRSSRVPRYDLIPLTALKRLAVRFTGKEVNGEPDGGALKYGEVNWIRGLPTSDVINHIEEHFRTWVECFRNNSFLYGNDMEKIREAMNECSKQNDHLAGAMWGLCVLMHQEMTALFHDDKFNTGSPADDEVTITPFLCNSCQRQFQDRYPMEDKNGFRFCSPECKGFSILK